MLRAWTLGMLLMGLLPAAAQAPAEPPENVTVTGTRAKEVIQDFVKSVTTPTHFAGKIARWETPICPYAMGVKPEAAAFIVKRIKDVAQAAGARVSTDKNCRYNIEVLFTSTPQALMDNVRKDHADVLGYAVSTDEKIRLAKFVRPIQSWYVTATRDRNGATEVDSPHTTNGNGVTMILPCSMLQPPPAPPGMCTLQNPYARKVNVDGSLLGDMTRSLFDNVLIVADPGKLADYELGAVSDYIAMLALAQVLSPDTCRDLPSILNLLAEGCPAHSPALTDNDRAYLRGLYAMQADKSLNVQRETIADEMQKAAENQ
jgi:hypothetical protein